MEKRIIIILYAVSLVAIILMLQQWVGFEHVINAAENANPLILGLAIAVFSCTIVVWTLRWRLFFRGLGIRVPMGETMKFLTIGLMFNNITPMAKFGGEPVKYYMMSKTRSIKYEKTAATIGADTIVQLVSYLTLAYLAVIILAIRNITYWEGLFIALNIIIFSMLFFLYVFSNKKHLDRIASRTAKLVAVFSRKKARKLRKAAFEVSDDTKKLMKNRRLVSQALCLSFVERSLEVLAFYLIFLSIGINIPIYIAVMAMGIAILAGNIPLFPGGLLTYEYFVILFITLFGVPLGGATAAVLIWRLISYWGVTFAGIVLAWWAGIILTRKKGRSGFIKNRFK